MEKGKNNNSIINRRTLLILLVMISYMSMMVSAFLLMDNMLYDRIIYTIERKYYLFSVLILAFVLFAISTASIILSKKKSNILLLENKEDNIQLHEIVECDSDDTVIDNIYNDNLNDSKFNSYILNILNEIKSNKIFFMVKSDYFVSMGRAFLLSGIAFYFLCIIAFQFFVYISPEKEIFKVYGMISCAVIFITIEFIGIWYLNQSRICVNKVMAMMNIELHINKCILIYNSDMSENAMYELLRIEFLNTDIKIDTTIQKMGAYPYKMFFETLRDMIKKGI